MLVLWGMRCTPSLPLLPGPLRPVIVATVRVKSIGQIELKYVLMLNWIAWNWTVFDIETVRSCLTKLVEIELFICIKMDMALNNP